MELAERAYPERRHLIHFEGAAQIRREIAHAVPFYDGIQNLQARGDAIQWGGSLLCSGGKFPTQTGKAYFSALEPPETQLPPGYFLLSTRRGKQFNSMVQSNHDPLTGSNRDAVFMNAEDARLAGWSEGEAVLVRSHVGELKGRVKLMAVRRGNVQVHWPEGNRLVRRRRLDPACEIPDYNTTVQVIALSEAKES
jgi:anaerobic selenocysteine-containing dehydrogenase